MDAQPTAPDFWAEGASPQVGEFIVKMREAGAHWLRLTETKSGFAMAGWKVRPDVEGERGPHYVLIT